MQIGKILLLVPFRVKQNPCSWRVEIYSEITQVIELKHKSMATESDCHYLFIVLLVFLGKKYGSLVLDHI